MAQLTGKDILLVEDETMISFLLEDMLLELGAATIRHAASIDQALAFVAERLPDLAVLDVNVAGRLIYPLAERLSAANVPFAFITGYGRGGLVPPWEDRPVIQKPFTQASLAQVLGKALS